MMSGYSKTTLLQKLGLMPAQISLVCQLPAEYCNWLMPHPPDVTHMSRVAPELDFVHLLVKGLKDFHEHSEKVKIIKYMRLMMCSRD